MTKIKFPLQELDLSEHICDFLNENMAQVRPALSFPEENANDRVQVDNISVKHVDINDDGSLAIEYEYSWSFYAGCKDINDGGLEQQTVTARLVGGVIELDVFETPDPCSTNEEL